jgi:hypothetical protein
VHSLPLPQGHWPPPSMPGALDFKLCPAEQLRFDALIEPSLHTNNSPSQRATPPFLPEHG